MGRMGRVRLVETKPCRLLSTRELGEDQRPASPGRDGAGDGGLGLNAEPVPEVGVVGRCDAA
jgi:hypothetical protein